jgi:septum formation inhibitor MinC
VDPGMGGMMMYEGNVRSGQQVIAPPGQSLMVYGSVNPGGEVLADGSIFIWGALNGRALAGISSSSSEDSSAKQQGQQKKTEELKVVCQRFDAELVAIGATFATVDQPPMGVHQWKRDAPTTVSGPPGGKLDFYSEPSRK